MALALGQATVRPGEGERDHRKEELGVFCQGLDTLCSIMLSMTRINVTVDRVRRKSLSGRQLSQFNLQDLPADFSLLPPDAEISTAFEHKPEAGLRGSPSILSLDSKVLRVVYRLEENPAEWPPAESCRLQRNGRGEGGLRRRRRTDEVRVLFDC